jgi:hypothetical protein
LKNFGNIPSLSTIYLYCLTRVSQALCTYNFIPARGDGYGK